MKKILLILTLFVAFGSYAQKNEKKQSKLEEYKITIKVLEEIKEHDQFLLRNDLKSSEYVIKYINIDHIDRIVEFIGNKKYIKNYTEILDKYFVKYEMYINNNLIEKKDTRIE